MSSEQEGLVCPRCGCKHFEVTHTLRQRCRIRRRRVCRHCGRAIYTVEISQTEMARRDQSSREA